VVDCQETSDGRWRWADVDVHTKALSKTKKKTTSRVGVRRTGNVGAPATVVGRERKREKYKTG
jgi:hypothetical protein